MGGGRWRLARALSAARTYRRSGTRQRGPAGAALHRAGRAQLAHRAGPGPWSQGGGEIPDLPDASPGPEERFGGDALRSRSSAGEQPGTRSHVGGSRIMKHVLVIDDEPFVRDALKRVLESEAVSLQAAGDAEAAPARLRGQTAGWGLLGVTI